VWENKQNQNKLSISVIVMMEIVVVVVVAGAGIVVASSQIANCRLKWQKQSERASID
jgi:Na+-transporting NADH:ubiquinone oxidoreductase subunit NqrC